MKKSSKKFIALLLKAIMLVTSIPLGAFIASAADGDAKDKYLFAYFTGNSQYGQQIRFAVSEDGYNFTALNKNRPVVSQTKGSSATSSGFARDPYIARDVNGNGYWMVATDMDASPAGMHKDWEGDSCIYTYHSTDLTDWTQVACIDMRNFSGFETARRAWAPQFIWDASKNQYMIYLTIFSSSSSWDNSIYALYTSDFKTVTAPQAITLSRTTTGAAIDADIVVNNGTYYMYFKDEKSTTVWVATASNLTGPYTAQKDVSSALSSKEVEGSAMYQITGTNTWVMMLDEYKNGTFAYGTTTDFINFTPYTGSTANNAALTARHGSVMPITTEEYNRIVEFYNSASSYTEFSYPWQTAQAAGNQGSWDAYRDSNGYEANVKGVANGANYVIGNGQAYLNGCGLLVQDERVKSLIASDSFSIGFSYKAQTLTPNAPIFTIYDGSGSGHINYVELLESGQLTIGGNVVASIADFKPAEENKFVFSYNGSTFSVYMNGKLAASAPADFNVKIVGDLYLGLGYNDVRDSVVGTYGQVNCTATAVNENVSLTGFEDVMAAFEKKLADGALYKNMGDAYDAYVKCQKAYDAYYYGGDESVDLTAAATELRTAMLSMTEWTETLPLKSVSQDGSLNADNLEYRDEMKNVLYAYGVSDNAPKKINTSDMEALSGSGMQYGEITFLYTGPNQTIACPINCIIRYQNVFPNINTYQAKSCYINTSNPENLVELKHNWHSLGENAGYKTGTAHGQFSYLDDSNQYSDSWRQNQSSAINCYSSNTLYFTGTLAANEYLKTINSITYQIKDNKNGSQQHTMDANCTNGSSVIRVINYEVLKNKITDAQSKNYLANITSYKEGGLKDYVDSLDRLLSFNLYNYFATASDNNYDACAAAIKAAVEGYKDTAAKDSDDYEALRTAIDTYRITAENADACPKYVTALGGAILTAQNAMAAVDDSENDYKPDYNSKNIGTIASELNNAVTDYKNSIHVYSWDSYDKTTGKVTFKCSSCEDSYQLEGQNYMTAAMIYDTLDKSKYTSDAIDAIETAKRIFDKIKTTRQAEKYIQQDIDDVTKALIAAMNSPLNKEDTERKWFVVTHIVVEDGVQSSSSKHDKRYGDTVSINYIPSNGVITSWDVQVGSSPVKTVATDVNDYMLYVQDNTVITTYVRKNTTSTYVNILDQYGKVLYSVPAAEGDAITCNGNTVTIAGNHYNVPNMPYMNVTEYTVNGVKYTSETEFKVKAGENKIVPKYDPVVSDYTITADDADVTVNGKVTNKAEYDDVVTVTFPEGTYAVAIQNTDGSYAVAAYGNTYTFFANRNMTFYAVSGSASNYTIGTTALDKDRDALTIHRLDYQLPFAYAEVALTDEAANKYTTFCSYSTETPAYDEETKKGVKILEKGTLVSRTAGLTDETFRIGMDGVSQAVNPNTTKYGNQYSLSIRNGGSVTTRAYVKYTYTYQGKEITAVSYGNICNAQ